MKQLINISFLVSLAIFVLTGCQKYEEIEPAVEQVVAGERASEAVASDGQEDEVTSSSSTLRGGREDSGRPSGDPDTVNDDDDEEDDDEEQSLAEID